MVLQSKVTSDFPHDSYNSELEVELINKHAKKRSHKRIVKKGTSLCLPEDFLTDHRLVRVVRRTKITPIELSTTASVFIEIVGGNKYPVNLSYSYIAKQYNSIAKKNFSTLRRQN